MSDAPQTVTLPYRPRLGDFVMMRRRLVGGEPQSYLVDSRNGMMYDLTEEEREVVACLDGTRDLGGVLLSAKRSGCYQRASGIQELLGQMQQAGLLVDGIAPPAPPRVRHPERPLEALADYRMQCDGSGGCCTVFATAAFSQPEVQRAMVHGHDCVNEPVDKTFLPLWGSVDHSTVAVTMTDGHCPFLRDSGHCAIHAEAGAEAKPLGCSIYPRTFVDDGAAVRVSVKVECACMMASSVNPSDDGEPLLGAAQTLEQHLHDRVHVVRLPDDIAVTRTSSEPRAALRSWSRAAIGAIEDATFDGVSALWSLADAAAKSSFDETAARAAVSSPTRPTPEAFRAHLDKLREVAALRCEGAQARVSTDRVRVLADWVHAAATALGADDVVAARLDEVAAPTREAFYVRALLWGHHLAEQGRTVEQGLRDRALRLLLARQLPHVASASTESDPAHSFPITAMEAMMRGQALERYADAL